MRCVVQRVEGAEVKVGDEVTGRIGRGLLVLAAFAPDDGEDELDWMARKLVNLRLFDDEQGRLNVSLAEVGGGVLLVSQFTLYGDCRRGNRPSFTASASPEVAAGLYARFGRRLREAWPQVAEGRFGARMEVSLVNAGPVTLVLDRDAGPAAP